MKLLFEHWREFLKENIFYVNAARLLPTEELTKPGEGYDTEKAVAEKMQQIQQGQLEPMEVCHQKPVNTYRLADSPMEKGGQVEPFYYVLDGHHRLEAINRLGIDKVPVYLTSKEINENKDSSYYVSEAKDINKIAKVVIIQDGKALILFRAGSQRHADKWDLPGGHLNEGEEPKEALLREVYEETGLTLSEPIGGLYTKENISFFKAMMPPQNITLSDEHTDYKFVSIDEIPENISGRFIKAIKASL